MACTACTRCKPADAGSSVLVVAADAFRLETVVRFLVGTFIGLMDGWMARACKAPHPSRYEVGLDRVDA